MKKIYCEDIYKEFGTPTGFNNVDLFHGFNAFVVSKSYEDKFNTLLAHPERQICTSTKWLGMMGVKVTGDILLASSYDLFSRVDVDTGKRWFEEDDLPYIVHDYKDIELHLDDDEENNEIVVTNVVITAIWITSDANNKLRALAKMLAEKHGLPLIEVGESIFS